MPKTLTIPHVKQVALKRATMTQLICNRLNWTEEYFLSFQFEAAFDFLEAVLHPVEKQDSKLLSRSSVFWGWWRNQWLRRDLQIYQWKSLDHEGYQQVHTISLLKCELTITSFWKNIESMLDAGEAYIIADQEAFV